MKDSTGKLFKNQFIRKPNTKNKANRLNQVRWTQPQGSQRRFNFSCAQVA
eukprot:m.153188 g.153188  ORF g.153188 m.153188 type:complete len:50 (+) comp24578_c0_seq5:167-316(+)